MEGLTPESVEAILKAVTADNIAGLQTLNQDLTGAPLKVQDLENVVRSLDYQLRDVKLYNLLPKIAAKSNVVEYALLKEYGGNRFDGAFFGETELPQVTDQTNERKGQITKNIYSLGQVSRLATEVDTIEDAMTQSQNARLMDVLRKHATAVYFGNAGTNDLEFNGFYKQHLDAFTSVANYFNNEVVVDLRGKSITQQTISDAAVVMDRGNRYPTHVFGTPGAMTAISQGFYQFQNTYLNSGQPLGAGNNVLMGTVVNKISTAFGDIDLMGEKFASRRPSKTTISGATSGQAPNAPVAGAVTAVIPANAPESQYQAGEDGNVFYAVSARNRFGESALTVLPDAVTATAIVAGGANDLAFTDGGGAIPATGYIVYRTQVTTAGAAAGLEFFPIIELSPTDLANGYDGAAANLVRDNGRILPGLSDAFMTDMSENTVSHRELIKPSRIDFAVTDLTYRFLIASRSTPILYAPAGFIKFINVAETLTP